jgi:hypothetical protein
LCTQRHKASICGDHEQVEEQPYCQNHDPDLMPVEQAKNQQPNLGANQTGSRQGNRNILTRGWQIEGKELWQKSNQRKPTIMKLRRLPDFLRQSCAKHAGQKAGENCSKQNHFLMRERTTTAIWGPGAQHQRGKRHE